MRAAPVLTTLLFIACAPADQLRLVFAEPATRAESVAAEVYAVASSTRTGAALDCDALLARGVPADSAVDADIVVVQRTSVTVPAQRGQAPLLVSLAPDQYLFFAEAHDDFGFVTARGCAPGEVGAAGSLDLQLRLYTAPAPAGRLEIVPPDSWVQHAGPDGLDTAPALTVRALDPDGAPQAGVEVRARIDQGEAVLLQSVLQTRASTSLGQDGTAQTRVLMGVGPVEISLHARGLQGSPLRFSVLGLASPARSLARYLGTLTPVALVSGSFDSQRPDSTALLALGGAAGHNLYRISLPDTDWPQWPFELLERRTGPGDRDVEPYGPVLAVAARLDDDALTDLATVSDADPPELFLHMHGSDPQRPVRMDSSYPVTTWIEDSHEQLVRIDRLLPLHFDDDPVDDLLIDAVIVDSELPAGSRRVRKLVVHEARPDMLHTRACAIRIDDVGLDFDLAAGDLDGDGRDELLLGLHQGDIMVFARRAALGGRWQYAAQPGLIDAPAGQRFMRVADVDGDARADLITVSNGCMPFPCVTVARGDGTLTGPGEQLRIELPSVTRLEGALFEDLNADGHLDVTLYSSDIGGALLLSGDGLGHLAYPLLIPAPIEFTAMAAAHLNGDGVLDLGLVGLSAGASNALLLVSE